MDIPNKPRAVLDLSFSSSLRVNTVQFVSKFVVCLSLLNGLSLTVGASGKKHEDLCRSW